jgi:hypothetical protein
MSNLEHLIENGLCRLQESKSYAEWREIMQQDVNWGGNEELFITVDTLWEICQYVIFTWCGTREQNERVRCKDCKYWSTETEQTAVPNMHKCTWWRTIGTLPIDFCSRAERRGEHGKTD